MKGILEKEEIERWFITNMRAAKVFLVSKDNPKERFAAVGWLDLSDSVVMNQARRSKGARVGSFVGAAGGGAFAGSGAGTSQSISLSFGDIVFLSNDREVLRFEAVSDPNDVNRLIKTLKKEYASAN